VLFSVVRAFSPSDMRADRSRGQARFKRLEDLQRKVQIVPLTKGIGAQDCLWFEVEQLQTEHPHPPR